MVVTGDGELGFDSGEGACETATTSVALGSRGWLHVSEVKLCRRETFLDYTVF